MELIQVSFCVKERIFLRPVVDNFTVNDIEECVYTSDTTEENSSNVGTETRSQICLNT